MRILSSEASRMADQQTIEKEGISSLNLMERAAREYVFALNKRFPKLGSGCVICGPGNNGGDGLAFARMMHQAGFDVGVFLHEQFASFSSDFQENRKRLPTGIEVKTGNHLQLSDWIQSKEWICDALFGTGLNKPLQEELKILVEKMNAFSGLRISIDTPSGLMREMNSSQTAFHAHWTGTFQTPKLEFLLPDTGKFTDEFEVISINLNVIEADNIGPEFFYLEKNEIAKILKKREKFSHKGTFGHGLIVAGSMGKMGAAVLATRAMVRSGVGLASVSVPTCGRDIMQISIPEAMVKVDFAKNHISEIPDLKSYSAVGIGPGIGTHSDTSFALYQLLQSARQPIVIDADALNLLSHHPEWMNHLPENSILTPHPKEFDRLAGHSETSFQRLNKAKELAHSKKVLIVLKGAHSAICLPDGSVFFNSSGNSGMATGGSGDVLTGILTGLLAQGYLPENAAKLGVFLHGLSGDLAKKRVGEQALCASDLIESLGPAFLELT